MVNTFIKRDELLLLLNKPFRCFVNISCVHIPGAVYGTSQAIAIPVFKGKLVAILKQLSAEATIRVAIEYEVSTDIRLKIP